VFRLMPIFRHTSSTLPASPSFSAATICSSVNLLFLMLPPAYFVRRRSHVSAGPTFGEQVRGDLRLTQFRGHRLWDALFLLERGQRAS
jgi:hypothetical protein